jgi:hypothetical protein
VIKEGYVTRTEEKDSQYVTYSLNQDKIGKLKEVGERTKNIVNHRRENEEEFLSLSIEDQIGNLISFFIHQKLEEIQAQIDYQLDPNNFDKHLALMFLNSPLFQFVEYWVINNALKDEDYRKAVLKRIDEWKKLTVGRS